MSRASEKLTNERKDEIINACAKLYKLKSFKEIRFQDIANETTFTRTSIYNYYKTKEEIFLALFEREYQDFNADLRNLIENNNTLKKEKLAEKIADIIDKRVLMLKLLAVNIYDMEDNSRSEMLVNFKMQYKKTLELFRELLKHFYKNIKDADIDKFIYTFLPFLHGVYPYVYHTAKQKLAMKKAKVNHKETTIKNMVESTLMFMLP